MHTPIPLPSLVKSLRLAVLPFILVGTTMFLGFLFHVRGERVVDALLRERLQSTVAISAGHFDPADIESVDGPEDQESAAYVRLVEHLKMTRSQAPGVRFAYIMRRTDDPAVLEFVADADALSSASELDTDKNGSVDPDEEPGLPGDEYPIEGNPALKDKAFLIPVVEEGFTVDQWGTLLSAYAPIVNEKGETVAVLGLDMIADDFYSQTQTTFSILAVALVTLVGALIAAYVMIIMRYRKAETLKQLDAERSALLDLATHQLGMPLATFRWWLEILRERDNGQFCRRGDVCDQLQEGIDRMDMIINALRDVSSLEAKTPGDLGQTPVAPAIRGLVKDLRKTFSLKKERLDINVEGDLPQVRLNKKLFVGMLRELLENACYYSRPGSQVTLNAKPARRGIEIEVTDQGIGITPDDQRHVFEKFRRGRNASSLRPVGNGLGLFIVKRIIDKAGGRIRLKSILGKGTTVNIFLPAA